MCAYIYVCVWIEGWGGGEREKVNTLYIWICIKVEKSKAD